MLVVPILSYSAEIVPYGEVGKHIGGSVGGSEIGGYLGDKLEDYGKSKPTEPIKECDNPYPYTATCVHERMDWFLWIS